MTTEFVCIRATHSYGYRYGHKFPWGIILGVQWSGNRICYRIEFFGGQIDLWPVYDDADPYEFKRLTVPSGYIPLPPDLRA